MAAPAFVQANKAGALTSSVQSLTVTLSANSTAGNGLLAVLCFGNVAATFSGPSGWSQIGVIQAQGETLAIWAYLNTVGGQSSFTWTTTATASGFSGIVSEFSNLALASVVDKTATNQTASSTSMTSGTTATTTQPVELWYAALCYTGGGTRTISGVTAGWTANKIADASNTAGTFGAHCSDYYQVAAATGTPSVAATLNTAANSNGIVLALFSTTTTATVSVGGAGGALPAAELDGAPAAGGQGGSAQTAELDAKASSGGQGGASPSAEMDAATGVGGTGGANPGAELDAVAATGGQGGVSAVALWLAALALGGAGGVTGRAAPTPGVAISTMLLLGVLRVVGEAAVSTTAVSMLASCGDRALFGATATTAQLANASAGDGASMTATSSTAAGPGNATSGDRLTG